MALGASGEWMGVRGMLSVVGCRLSVVGCRLSVVGCRLSVVGCRLSVVGCRNYRDRLLFRQQQLTTSNLSQIGYRYTPFTTPVRLTRRITSARCLRSFTSRVNSKVAANGLRSEYSTFSMLEPAAAIAAATVASTPGRLTTSLRNCAL